jgi:hypothetical protein
LSLVERENSSTTVVTMVIGALCDRVPHSPSGLGCSRPTAEPSITPKPYFNTQIISAEIYGDRYNQGQHDVDISRRNFIKTASGTLTIGAAAGSTALQVSADLTSDQPQEQLCGSIDDFRNRPSHFHHTGPFYDGKGREEVEFPWDRLTGEPLIYASMGTIPNGQADVFRQPIWWSSLSE